MNRYGALIAENAKLFPKSFDALNTYFRNQSILAIRK